MGMNGTGGASTPTQNYGNYPTQGPSAPPGAGSPDLSSTGGLDPNSLTPQDQLMLSSMMNQAPSGPPPEEKKKNTLAWILGGTAAVGATIGAVVLASKGIRSSSLTKQIKTSNGLAKDHNSDVLKKYTTDENGKVSHEGIVEADKMEHPKAYGHMLKTSLSKKDTDLEKYLKDDLKLNDEHRIAVTDWHTENIKKLKAD